MRVIWAGMLVVVMFAAGIKAGADEIAPDALITLDRMETAYAGVQDYTANFLKQERVGGELLPEENILLKFKKPFKIYLKWLKGPHEGREALYVDGKYDNKVIGHEGGLFGFVTLHMDPKGKIATLDNRHSILDVGIGRLIDIVMENVRRAHKAGELKPAITDDAAFGKPAKKIDVILPNDRTKGYYASRFELWTDNETGLPVRLKAYGWDGELIESYGYKDLKVNQGLKDGEFEPDNPEYKF
jgi:outer membrane lipoprotein-sorting protein